MADTKNNKAKGNRFLVAGAVAVGLGSVALIGCTKAFDVEHSAGIQAADFDGSPADQASLDLEGFDKDDYNAHDGTSLLQEMSWYEYSWHQVAVFFMGEYVIKNWDNPYWTPDPYS